jgi:hypothetical protein
MKTRTMKVALVLVAALVFVGVVAALAAAGAPTVRGVQPVEYPGNFVSSDDDQVCYDMSALGYIGEVTSEMRGFKIDPPVDYDDGYVSTTISADGKYLDWESINATVLAFIIKGGPSYNVYNYVGTGFNWDKLLHSPVTINKGKTIVPQISHYNVCYLPDPQGEFTGCTPGYWRNHYDRWEGYNSYEIFDTVFDVTYLGETVTLGMAINNPQTYGTFAFHAVAALLNSTGGVPNADGTTVDYPYTTAEVIEMVQDAVAYETFEDIKNDLAAANELGCPLSGTKAVKVP